MKKPKATAPTFDKDHTFGPCHYCEYSMTRAFTGPPMVAVCELCLERELAKDGILRQPEHYVI